MLDESLRAALAHRPRPRLSAFFTARVMANLPARRGRWLVGAYWLATVGASAWILTLHPILPPAWTPYLIASLVPATLFCAAFVIPKLMWFAGRR
jgi:anti-sigma factor RsiW